MQSDNLPTTRGTVTIRVKTPEERDAWVKAHPPRHPVTDAHLELLRRVKETLS